MSAINDRRAGLLDAMDEQPTSLDEWARHLRHRMVEHLAGASDDVEMSHQLADDLSWTAAMAPEAAFLSHGRALSPTRSPVRTPRRPRRRGSLVLVIAPLFDLGATAWVLVPLLVALLVPAAVATLAAGSNQDPRAGTGAALWTGVIGGHLVFVVVVTAAYVSDGRPTTPR